MAGCYVIVLFYFTFHEAPRWCFDYIYSGLLFRKQKDFLLLTMAPFCASRMEFDFDTIEEEDSPYPEVRASVSNIDDQDMPALTIRMWFVGLLLCMTSRQVYFLTTFVPF